MGVVDLLPCDQQGCLVHSRTKHMKTLEEVPKFISERQLTVRVQLDRNIYMLLICADAPTLTSEEEIKDTFYKDLDQVNL